MSDILSVEDALNITADGRREVALPSGAGTVVVSSLTKAQTTRLRDDSALDLESGNVDLSKFEPELFELGMVEPKLSREQVDRVFETWPAADVDAVLTAIVDASGLGAGFSESDEAGDGEE